MIGRRGRAAAALCLGLLVVAGCRRGADSGRLADGTPVVLISIDTLRSDRLPAYGYGAVDTPAIDALRRDGILYERAYTPAPLTLPAHVSLLTGLLPPAHGVRDNLGYTVSGARTPMLQQRLAERGYATGAAVSAFVLRGATGIGEGFGFYDDELEVAAGRGLQGIQRAGPATLERVRPWLRSAAGGPFFLFFHLFEPHSPYQPPEPFASRYAVAYDGEVAAADAVVGDLIAELRALGVYDRALIVLLSDHGEGLGEHGEDEHGLFLYRSTLQVPLILKLPGAARAGASVAHPVQLVDLAPTVLEGLGLAVDEALPGRSLLAAPPEPGAVAIFAETVFPRLHFGWSDLASVIVGDSQYIGAPRPELYDLVADPGQTTDLVGREPELAAELAARLGAWERELAPPGAADAETRRRLAALGYLGSAVIADDAALPDPKDRVGVLRQLREAYRRFERADWEGAAAAFAEVLAGDPGIEDAWDLRGQALQRSGRPELALATYLEGLRATRQSPRLALSAASLLAPAGRLAEAAELAQLATGHDPALARVLLARIALAQGDLAAAETAARAAVAVGDPRPGPALALADVLLAAGRPEEAEQALAGLAAAQNPEALLALGRLAAQRQRWDEAGSLFERARQADPDNPLVAVNLGLLALAGGRVAEGRTLLERGVEGAPASFEGWNGLGMARVQSGDLEGGIAAWERALALRPRADELLYNLGLAHAQAGRPQRAAEYLEAYATRSASPQAARAREMAAELRRRAAAGR
ncbi:MAG: sulfatase-like hydrolase/transferase [Thermoanaerobaculales bacterium]|nr:sulfatase-like hydrolase/transferase [Thermoanaerobaculales bacterium]